MSRLVELNKLEADKSGVFSNPESAERDFAYSDGNEAERYLLEVLQNASDLGSASEELQLLIKDWPSEYHLSPKRANLLRPLPIDRGARVLELGCGCGAITRYLGETGCDVDAIEGSSVRARLARLRCKDLGNVRLVHANFNRLVLPEQEYDFVLLIGVAEYARRFSPDSESDRGAVVDLLERVRTALKPGGRVLIAIENRTGMKYLHGAHEDHYSLRFVGIDDYSEPAGIRTYTRREWNRIAADCDFSNRVFLYPFPDYKLPTLYLGDDYCSRDENAWCHLEGIDSTDYTFLFDPYIPESLTWQGYNAAGVLGEMANSFMLVLSQEDNLQGFADIDFVHLPDFRRKRQFCTVVEKKRGEDVVARRPLDAVPSTREEQSEETEPYIDGVLLSALWVRSIMIHPDPARFHGYLRDYVSFIEEYAGLERLPADLLPNNIVVDRAGNYRVFDQEWRGEENLDDDYLLFRALVTFANHYRQAIRQFARHYDIHTVGGFIRHAFRILGRADRVPEMYCDREDAFQNRVQLERKHSTAELLEMPIMESPARAAFHARIGWTADGRFDDRNESSTVLYSSAAPSVLRFTLPVQAGNVRQLRFRPFDENRPFDSGFFDVDDISITAGSGDNARVVWSLGDRNAVLDAARLTGLIVIEEEGGRFLAASGDEPAMTFSPDLSMAEPSDRPLVVTVTIQHRACREYQLARSECLARNADLEQRVESLEQALRHARKAKADLDRITRSRTWRWISALRRAMPRGKLR